ncbi:conserved protein of unknown function [Vibrio tapetis subsp. tapetis]|uniref:HTH araC/xylS-type domain-containing protein n=1 Tax=Vibrio tapetis subsp. tapetis TaxID=1671868 RepID=A0A2N8ZIS0_9VIBR|nr:conserved protein of unknown function [Vibrio tapetis subsp. tapetis]
MLSDSDFIPLEPFNRLIDITSTQLGITQFSALLALSFRKHIIPQLLPTFSKYHTVGEALGNIDVILSKDFPGSNVWLERKQDKSWFCRRPPFEHSPVLEWGEAFAIIYIIELINALTRKQWHPTNIKLQGRESDIVKSILPKQCRLSIEQGATSVCIPNHMLTTPLSLFSQILRASPTTVEWHTSFTDSVFELLRPYVRERNLSLEEAAELLNFSVRTLQRNLAKEKTSFRKVKENLMFTVACELMEEGHNLTYISNQLGYHDISKFSRAFKRVSGLAPSVYKKSIIALHSQ